MTNQRMTANQLVAYNLRRARTLLGLTQEQAARELEPYLGERWSKRVFSAAERSVTGERVRQFTADQLVAFAAAFDLPVSFFLEAPSPGMTVAALGAEEGVTGRQLTELATGSEHHQARIEQAKQLRVVEHMRELAELGVELPPIDLNKLGKEQQ
jgi:transcriptional regulator with XRE-family HTH domain